MVRAGPSAQISPLFCGNEPSGGARHRFSSSRDYRCIRGTGLPTQTSVDRVFLDIDELCATHQALGLDIAVEEDGSTTERADFTFFERVKGHIKE